jgi:hypothetical protein
MKKRQNSKSYDFFKNLEDREELSLKKVKEEKNVKK